MRLNLLPYFLLYALGGCILAADGAVMDLLLGQFLWNPETFGLVLMLRGFCSAIGTVLGSSLVHKYDLRLLLRHCCLFIALGMSAFYFADLAFPPALVTSARVLGAALVGLAVGLSATTNNMRALLSPEVHKSFAWLQMGFTAGATVAPLLLGPWREHASRLIAAGASPGIWRLPISGVIAAALVLALLTPYWDKARPRLPAKSKLADALPEAATDPLSDGPSAMSDGNGTISDASAKRSLRSPRKPALVAATLLFCYVGIEINLSNGILIFTQSTHAGGELAAGWSAAAFWCGLLSSRLISALKPMPATRQPRRLVSLSVAACACIALFASGASGGSGAATLVLIAGAGLCLGAIYSLGVSSVSLLYLPEDARVRTHHVVSLSALGSILLPPLFGIIWEHLGIAAGMVFVLALALSMAAAAWALSRMPLPGLKSHAPP